MFHQTDGPQLLGKRIRSGGGAPFHPGDEEGAARIKDEGLGGPLRQSGPEDGWRGRGAANSVSWD